MNDLFQLMKGYHVKVTLLVLVLLLLWEGIAPFFGFFRQHSKERAVHAVRNFILGTINVLLGTAIVTGVIFGLAHYVEENRIGLRYLLDLPEWANICMAILALDVWTYWWHRFNHRIYFLWRFHQVHHSDPNMDVTTAYRFHFGELFLSHFLRAPLIPIFGIHLWEIVLFELLMFTNVQFHHANIGISTKWDQWFRLIFTSPEMHKVHHSVKREEYDSNFTALFSCWDRLFGTYKTVDDPHQIVFGLKDSRDPGSQTIPSLLEAPLKTSKREKSR